MATVNGNEYANILTGSASNDTLNGLGGNDTLYGNGGDDTLDGGTGNDLLVGGRGSDSYRFGLGYGFDVIDNSGGANNDVDTLLLTNLNANQIRLTRIGNDLVLSVLASGETLTVSQNFLDADHAIDRIQFADGSHWSASVMLANLYYPPVVPTDGADVINGNPDDDSLLGLGGDDTLYGNGGNDTLDGGSGNDRMEGGVGNDTYVVDAASDVVVEANNAGDDLVQASISYTLGNNVERLTLTGSANINCTGNALANTLIGNAGNNLLDGGGGNDLIQGGDGNDTLQGGAGNDSLNGDAGNDLLDGGAGNDSMVGGSGDDIYIVDQSGDSLSELAGGGNDTVRASLNYSLVANLENLELTGTSNLNGTGNALANSLTGNTGNNLLDGGAGDDFLAGRRGSDTYRYGTSYGNDVIDNSGGASADVDTVQLVGLNSNNVRFVHTGNDLQMVVLATSQTLTLKNFYLGADYEIDQVRFGNNVVWNTAALKAAATLPVNAAPSSTNDTQTTLEDTPVILGSADFGTYSDPENTPLAAVKITSLPLLGSLQYNNGSAWGAVVQDQVISKADLDAGKLQFVPALNGNGSGYVSIGFKVSDGTAFAVNANTLSVNVTPVNDAPTVSSPVSLANGVEDTPYTFTTAQLLANASDVDAGTTLSVQSVSVDSGLGALTNNGNGTWTFTPASNLNGPVNFAVVVSDGSLQVATSAQLNLAAVNDVPVISPGQWTAGSENGFVSANVAYGTQDPDGDSLSYTFDPQSTLGGSISAIAEAPGAFFYSANSSAIDSLAEGAQAVDVIAFTVQDGHGGSAAGTFEIHLSGVNDAPIVSGPVSLPDGVEDSAYTLTAAQLLANASDVDIGDSLSVQSVSVDPADGLITANPDGSWTFTPTLDRNGLVNFALVIADSAGATVATSANLSLASVDDAPAAVATVTALSDDSGTAGDFLTNVASQTVSGTYTDNLNSGEIIQVSADGGTTWVNAAADNATHSWSASGVTLISSGTGLLVQTINATGNSRAGTGHSYTLDNSADVGNDLRVILADSLINNAEKTAIAYSVTGLDADASATITFSDASNHHVVGVNGSADLSSLSDGPIKVSIVATDVAGNSAIHGSGTRTLMFDDLVPGSALNNQYVALGVTVSGANIISSSPLFPSHSGTNLAYSELGFMTFIFTIGNIQTVSAYVSGDAGTGLFAYNASGVLVGQALLAGDGVNSLLSVTSSGGPIVGLQISGDGWFLGVDDLTFSGGVGLILDTSADTGGDLTVSLADALINNAEKTAVAYTVTGLDTDASATVRFSDGSQSVVGVNGSANLSSLSDGPISVSVTASDTAGNTASGIGSTFTLDTTAPLVSGPVTLTDGSEDSAYTFSAAQLLANTSDIGNSPSVKSVNVSPNDGTLADHGNGSWTFTPAANRNGAVTFNVVVTDGGNDVATSANLNLAPVNDPPTLANPLTDQNASQDNSINFSVPADTFVDVDGDTLSYSASQANGDSLPAWLSFDPVNRSFSGTPGNGDVGSLSVRVTATDGSNATASSSFVLSIGNTNDAPVVSAPSALPSGTEDTAYGITAAQLLANASDPDGDALSVANLSANHGTLVDNGDDSWTFTPDANYNGAVTLNYQVIDGNGGSVATNQGFSLAAINDAPTGAVAISGNATAGQTLSASNSLADIDGLGIIGYQWQRSSDGNSWSAIASATGNTYTLSAADVGQHVRVEARYIDDGGTAEVVASTATTPVAAQLNLIEGVPGNDPLTGTAAADSLLGHGGNDTLLGLAGDDELEGGAGNDRLDGGAGNDSAVYSAGMNQYTFTFDPHGYLAVEAGVGSGEAGRDQISAVEQLHFAIGTVTVNGAPGGEVLVNTTTANNQINPSVVALAGGGYVVIWQALNLIGNGYDIYAQRYDANGNKFGEEALVNPFLANDQTNPSVAGLAGGGYIVTWESYGQDSSGYGVYAQRYDASGAAAGGEVRVNTVTVNEQLNPRVAALANGGYVVSWMSWDQDGSAYGVYAQRYDASGAAMGGEVRVNSTTFSSQQQSTIGALSDGGYVVSWMSLGQDGSDFGVYTQRYTTSGAAVGGEVRVNTVTVNDQTNPSIAGLAGGGYVVTWESYGQDGSGYGVYAQRYAASGATVGGEVRVNSTTASDQYQPTISGLSDGGYMIIWVSSNQDGSGLGIYAQRYAANGAAVGDEVRVNGTTASDQYQPTISGLSDGGYVVSWMSYGQDGSGGGIYAQRYDASGQAVVNTLTLAGDAGDNLVQLGSGDERIAGGGGNDTLFGGEGHDTALYQGNQHDFAFNAQAVDLISVNDMNSANGNEGLDTLHGFETLQFGDGVRLQALRGEVRVNSTTLDTQQDPMIAALSDGGYVVSWTSFGQDGSNTGVYAQRYDARGAAMGGEVRVNSTTLSSQEQPAISALSDGSYVVSWASFGQDGSNWGVYMRHYDANGAAVSGEVRVNSTTVDSQEHPAISTLSDGGYVVSWSSYGQDGSNTGVYAQRYNASGATVGGEVKVNSTTPDNQDQQVIAALSDGGFVVSWTSRDQDGSNTGIYAQRYDASGAALGAEVRVNSTTLGSQELPAISALSEGGYVVSWTSYGQDGSDWGVYAQRYDVNNATVGGEVRVNSTTLDSQEQSVIAALSDGGYVVSWMANFQDGSSWGIYTQRYDASGAVVGGEVRVNSTTFDSQMLPTIGTLSDGGYVVSWTSSDQDGSGYNIYSQRYDANGNPVLDHLEWTGDASANLIRSTLETDWFSGGTGADTFQFAQLPGDRADLITDFTQGSDVLALNSGLFNLQGQTVADTLANVSGAQNEVAGAHLVFNQNDHTLYYDADGAANGNAVAVVTLTGVTTLTASDVQLYV